MSAAASKAKMSRFKRVTDLFEEGRIVVLDDNPEDPVVVWVNKINPFEMEEARKDGSVGRARALLRLDQPDSPETLLFEQSLVGRTDEMLVAALVLSHQSEDYIAALDDLKADPEWKDNLAVLERADSQLMDAGTAPDDDEAKYLSSLNQAYMQAIADLVAKHQEKRQSDYSGMTSEELRDKYRLSYRDQAGSNGFLNEYRTTELYFALRDCQAMPSDNLSWDHSRCSHRTRLCESRAEVRELPEGLIVAVREAITLLNMTARDAGNSDAPASSSASSEQPSAAAESTPSTPVEK